MVIDIANFNFDGGSGGGGKPALLQEKTATIVQNGSQTITPDEGFDGMSSVQINAAITGASSAIDFSQIGYSDELSAELNAKWNNDVAYSKPLYDSWDPNNIDCLKVPYEYVKSLKYYPKFPVEELTTKMYINCYNASGMTVFPTFNSINVAVRQSAFNGCSSIEEIDLSGIAPATSLRWAFQYCKELKKLTLPPNRTISNEGLYCAFEGCNKLTEINNFDSLTTNGITTISNMFRSCSGFTRIDISHFDCSLVTDTNYAFENCENLEELLIPDNLGELCTSWRGFLNYCEKLKKISGSISLRCNKSNINSGDITGYYSLDNLRKFTIKDIGYTSGCTSVDIRNLTVWGENTDEIPDARQSLIDSLITYSFDRASSGYPTCDIILSTNTKALLTEDEKAQITAKGFTI